MTVSRLFSSKTRFKKEKATSEKSKSEVKRGVEILRSKVSSLKQVLDFKVCIKYSKIISSNGHKAIKVNKNSIGQFGRMAMQPFSPILFFVDIHGYLPIRHYYPCYFLST